MKFIVVVEKEKMKEKSCDWIENLKKKIGGCLRKKNCIRENLIKTRGREELDQRGVTVH